MGDRRALKGPPLLALLDNYLHLYPLAVRAFYPDFIRLKLENWTGVGDGGFACG